MHNYSIGLRVAVVAGAVLLSAFTTRAAVSDTRLAVIAADRTLDPFADVLAVALSKRSSVTLLERAEIGRIQSEQQLAASGNRDFVNLGQLLRADGVIVLLRVRDQQQQLVAASLVSVGLGIRLAIDAAPFPLDNPTTWAANISDRFGLLLPKLAIPKQEAVPVSLLNLRAAVMTTEAKVLEQSLSFLLAERLVRQREVFVLERQHLGALEVEKEIPSRSEAPDWAIAKFVVDGEITQGGPEPEKITLRMRIEPPQTRTPTNFTVTGSRSQLAQLVDEAAGKILASVVQSPRLSSWQPQEEAQRFYREAMSASRAGLDEEALGAAEASHALGFRGEDLTAMIARLSCRKAFSPRSRFLRSQVSDGFDRNQVDESTLDVGLVQRALDLVLDQMKGDPGLEVLLTPARMIRYYLGTDHYAAHRQELETLRATLRTLVERRAAQGATNSFDFCGFLGSYAPYLYDEPRQVIECYRKVLRQRFGQNDIYATARARHYLTEARDKPSLFGTHDLAQRTPWLVNWKHDSPQYLAQVWNAFLGELSGSKDVNDRLDALLLRLYSLDDKQPRAPVEKQIESALLEQREAIATNRFTHAIAVQLLYAIQGEEELRFKLLDSFFKRADFYDWQLLEYGFLGKPIEVKPGASPWGFRKPEFASALLKSMDTYAGRMEGRRDFQAAEFAKYRQRLLSVAAGAAGAGTVRTLRVEMSWSPMLSGESSRWRDDFCIRKVVFRDKQIWVLGKPLFPGTNAVGMKVFQVDPETFVAGSLDVPFTAAPKHSGWPDMGFDFDVSPEHVFVTTQGKLLRYDRAKRTWDSTDVPPADFPALTVLGDNVYYAFPGHMGIWGMPQPASGIIRIHQHSFDQEVLASSRRKPSATILDDVSPYKVPSLFLGSGGALHAVANFDGVRRGENLKVFRYSETTRDWTQVLANELEGNKGRFGLLAFPDRDGVMFQRLDVTARSAEFSAMRLDGNGRFARLMGPDDKRTNSASRSKWLAPTKPWDYSNAPSTPLVAALDGNEYWALLKHPDSPTDSLVLYWFKLGSAEPVMVTLSFADPKPGIKIANLDPSLLATPSGLVLGNAGGAAFWLIRPQELEVIRKAGGGTTSSQP